jgi:hypothetical protein
LERGLVMEAAREIRHTSSLYMRCQELFTAYPLAAGAVADDSVIQSMVLVLGDGDETRYFVLSHNRSAEGSWYSLCPWPTGPAVPIEADAGLPIPGIFECALTCGVPIPKDGSLLGWRCGDVIAALIAVYTGYTPESPEPCWSVMPLAGVPEAQWPPFTGEPLIGEPFWELVRAGEIVSLGDLIARSPDTVFWAAADEIPGSGCCVVARDIASPSGYTLRKGCYVYYTALQAHREIPSLAEFLADSSKVDLTARF